MLVLFDTPAGYALFEVLDTSALASADDVHRRFASAAAAQAVLKLKAFSKFEDTTTALAAATAICDRNLDKSLQNFLKEAVAKEKEGADKVSAARRSTAAAAAQRGEREVVRRSAACTAARHAAQERGSSAQPRSVLTVPPPPLSGDSRRV